MKEPIYVVGYPRSGNTWLSRLLGDVLDSPVDRYEAANPLAVEGLDRPGAFSIRQLHLHPTEEDIGDQPTATYIYPHKWNGDRIIHIVRDPRDIAVSAKFYWEISSIREVINAMRDGSRFLPGNAWGKFIRDWQNVNIKVTWTYYESFINKGYRELKRVMKDLNLPKVPDEKIKSSFDRQSFNKKIIQINNDGDGRPYGKTIQLKHLRKGVAGDWKNYFSREDCEYIQSCFGDLMLELGYTTHEHWYLD